MTRSLVIIENSTIQALASNPRAVEELPFLRAVKAATPKGGRSCCSRNKSPNDAIAAAKLAIVSLPQKKKKALKKILNAKKVRLRYMSNSGKAVEYTF